MADFASDAAAVAQALRDGASKLDDLLRRVGWAAQDALEGRAGESPFADDEGLAPEALALQFAARTLAPRVFPEIRAALQGGLAKLRRLEEKVVPVPAAEPESATLKKKAPRGRGRKARK